jgi:hypothetical protein
MSNPLDDFADILGMGSPFDPTGERAAKFDKDVADIAAKHAKKGAPPVAPIPDARVCKTTAELADWFKAFARACHASLPIERE